MIRSEKPIDGLVNNAAVMQPTHRTVTKDGVEVQLQVGRVFCGTAASPRVFYRTAF